MAHRENHSLIDKILNIWINDVARRIRILNENKDRGNQVSASNRRRTKSAPKTRQVDVKG